MGFHYARDHDLAGFWGEVCELAHRVHREAALLPPTPIADLEKTLNIDPTPEAVSSGVFRQVSFAPPVVVSGLPTRTKPLARRTLPRGMNREGSGAADIVWVIGKGDSCDPFTKNDAGGTPASQLLCHHHAQLPAGGKRFCQAFSQVSRQARPQRTSNLPSLSAD